MPVWLIGIVEWAVGWIFGGAKQAQGEAQGKAEAERDAGLGALQDVQKAEDARRGVKEDAGEIATDPNNRG